MENINTLLVAFMFITILTLGIAGFPGELTEVVRNVERKDRDRLLVGWRAPWSTSGPSAQRSNRQSGLS